LCDILSAMDRRASRDLHALLKALDRRIASSEGSVEALLQERADLIAEIDIWRKVGRRAGDRPKLDWAS
jgi:hypothetical protein